MKMHFAAAILAVTTTVGCSWSDAEPSTSAFFDSELAGARNRVDPSSRVGAFPESATETQRRALWFVNAYRMEAGLSAVDQIDTLNQATSAHAAYVQGHSDLYDQGLSVHKEVAGLPGFVGERFWNRMDAAGYKGEPFREVIAFQATPEAAVAHWMETVYHRIPLVHPAARHMGYGHVAQAGRGINVIDMGAGLAAADAGASIAWPRPGATDVELSWDGLESPQPPAPVGGYPSGPVITLVWGAGRPEVTSHRIVDVTAGGAALGHVLLTPDNDANLHGESAIALYPNQPLEPGHSIQVSVVGTLDGVPFEKTWSFTTRPAGCSLTAQNCGTGKGCYGASVQTAVCAWAGDVGHGASCTYQNDCGAGLTCVGQICRAYCQMGDKNGCQAMCPGGYSLVDTAAGIAVCR